MKQHETDLVVKCTLFPSIFACYVVFLPFFTCLSYIYNNDRGYKCMFLNVGANTDIYIKKSKAEVSHFQKYSGH